jgi:hypothetical protein
MKPSLRNLFMKWLTRDRGGHYGQRSCEPRKQAEHMAAPTQRCDVKISLANPEPSTHGTEQDQGSQMPGGSPALGLVVACGASPVMNNFPLAGRRRGPGVPPCSAFHTRPLPPRLREELPTSMLILSVQGRWIATTEGKKMPPAVKPGAERKDSDDLKSNIQVL